MQNLTQRMTKLQQLGATTGTDLKLDIPQIVVLGGQSVGKSSVLERVGNEEFLPRGKGIVTRVPIVLTLVNTPEGDERRASFGAEQSGSFAVFGEQKTAVNIRDVRAEIEKQTQERVGGFKDVADKPIFLTIYSEKVSNLSLVDLPGLTGQAGSGQPEDISQKIEDMALKYIRSENAIILAISEATSDIINSQSLRLAKQVDPERKRTIAVLTKLDMAWENRSEVLLREFAGDPLHIRLGIIGVMNRSDAHRTQTMDEFLPLEEEFLARHDLSKQHGIRVLSETLANHLQAHIRKCVPDLERQVKRKTQAVRNALLKLGEKCEPTKTSILKIVDEFATTYKQRIKFGIALDAETQTSAADIADIFDPAYTNELRKIVPLEGYDDRKLDKRLKQYTGIRPKDMPPPEFMLDLTREQVEKMQDPSEHCADQVYDKLLDLFAVCDDKNVFDRYPNIERFFRDVLKTLLDEQLEIAKDYIKATISMQSSFINDRYPPYQRRSEKIDARKAPPPPPAADKPKGMFESITVDGDEQNGNLGYLDALETLGRSEPTTVKRVRQKVCAYFESSREVVSDNVKKLLVFHLIDHIERHYGFELNDRASDANFEELFAERFEVGEKRRQLERELTTLERADETIRDLYANSKA